ncbi:MAG: helix-hairpin-helix domain-containing protein [Bacteroidaceae bacterium]|nr:helix-hairpin-helix domain-containing protein [Bacteroidaceae bacterium]
MKRLPFLTKSQRRALLVLEWVLLLGVIGIAIWQTSRPSPDLSLVGRGENTNGKTINTSPYKGEAGRGSTLPQEAPFETFPFDPNTADSTALLRLGLSPRQVRSIYRYRAKHGRYHTPEDFTRLPGLTNEQWERLKPYIRIAKEFQYVEQPPPSNFPVKGEDKEREDTLHKVSPTRGDLEGSERAVKLTSGQTIDINTADTTLLKMIPGIASKRAARIVAYRKALGGFVAVEQAMEAIEMPDSVLKYMTVSAVPVTKINVNKLSVQQLMKHPYLNFYQAKAIFEYRRNKGDLHSIDELSRLEGFRPTDIDKLRPYMVFE